jgi:RNA polymerase sigma-70 factor (ECF subfamily)
MLGAVTDDELMTSVAAGDDDAFSELVERHQLRVWRIATYLLRDRAVAEDVAQQAFLKIFLNAAAYRPAGKFLAYLRQVVVRLCLDHESRPRHHALPDNVPSSATGAPEQLEDRDRTRAVRTAVLALPETQRLVVVLKYFEGLSYAEIATLTQLTEKAVESLLVRARRNLLPLLEKWLSG